MITNIFITLAKGSCNKTAISLGSGGPEVPRSAGPQISLQKNLVKLYYAFENDKLFENSNIEIDHTKISKTIISEFSSDIFYLFLSCFELLSSCRAFLWHRYITNINFATWSYIQEFFPSKSLILENKSDFSLHLVSLDH